MKSGREELRRGVREILEGASQDLESLMSTPVPPPEERRPHTAATEARPVLRLVRDPAPHVPAATVPPPPRARGGPPGAAPGARSGPPRAGGHGPPADSGGRPAGDAGRPAEEGGLPGLLHQQALLGAPGGLLQHRPAGLHDPGVPDLPPL